MWLKIKWLRQTKNGASGRVAQAAVIEIFEYEILYTKPYTTGKHYFWVTISIFDNVCNNFLHEADAIM